MLERIETGGGAQRALNLVLIASLALAAVAFLALAISGRLAAGAALALGLILGGLNGRLVARTLVSGLPFGAVSAARLMLLSMLALGLGLALGFEVVWLVILGVGVSQLLLAGITAMEAIKR